MVAQESLQALQVQRSKCLEDSTGVGALPYTQKVQSPAKAANTNLHLSDPMIASGALNSRLNFTSSMPLSLATRHSSITLFLPNIGALTPRL